MKTRLGLTALLVLIVAAVVAPTADAKTIKLYMKPSFDYAGFCRAAPDQVKWSYTFKAKFTRKNSPYPKNAIIRYKVTDAATGAVIVSQKITLKPKKFFKVAALTTYTAGQSITLDVDASFKFPATGKTVRSPHGTFADVVPTVEQLDALANPLPPCAA